MNKIMCHVNYSHLTLIEVATKTGSPIDEYPSTGSKMSHLFNVLIWFFPLIMVSRSRKQSTLWIIPKVYLYKFDGNQAKCLRDTCF